MGKYLVYADTKKRLSLLISPTHDSMLGNQDRKINSFLYSQNICFLILIFCCICLMVPEVGLEPTTFRVWTGCSIQLSYSGKYITSTQLHRLFLSGPIYLSRPSSTIPSMWFKWSLLADSNRSLNSHNVACYHYTKAGIFKTLYILCKMWDSNPRPKVFKTFARPTELTSRWIVNLL